MHTHNYRDNSSFHGQRVVIMGAAPSGQDINLDIAKVADKVQLMRKLGFSYGNIGIEPN